MDLTFWAGQVAEMLRERATLRSAEWPDDPAAAVFAYCAGLLEREAQRFAQAELTVPEAAVESGYSEAHLRDLAHQGTLPLVDGTGRMRIRRRDLPRKPGLGVDRPHLSAGSQALAERVGPRRSR